MAAEAFVAQARLRESVGPFICLPAEQFIPQLMDLASEPYYIALLSAAERHGAAQQRPQAVQVMVRKNRAAIECGRAHVEFVARHDLDRMPVKEFNKRRNLSPASFLGDSPVPEPVPPNPSRLTGLRATQHISACSQANNRCPPLPLLFMQHEAFDGRRIRVDQVAEVEQRHII